LKSKKLIFQLISFFVPFSVYLTTLAPTLSFIDTGELAAVCIKLGVAHPTGYPLFTLLGSIFSKIPLGEDIYRLNIMCAFISSVTILMFFNLMVFILTEMNVEKSNAGSNSKDSVLAGGFDSISVYFSALTSSLILAFSNTFWNTANSLEVYSLHTFFIVAILYTFLKAVTDYTSGIENIKGVRYWLIFAFVLGLSFTNHLSTIFLSVGFIYMYFAVNGFNQTAFKKIAVMLIPFALALTVYIYFPVRADNPVISWGYPINFDNFYRHVSGKQFSIWMFSSTDSASKQFSNFLSSFPKEFFYLPLIAGIAGLIHLFKKQKRFFYFTSLLFVFNVLYAINYDIHDIDTYYLLAFIVTAIWAGTGIIFIASKIKDNPGTIIYGSLILAFLTFYGSYKENDESKNYFVQDYTMNVFNSARTNSIIMSTQWDFWVSASFYYQFVKGMRPDIIVIDKELLRKSWYLRHIRIHYAELYAKCRNEFELYETELLKFEKYTSNYTQPKTEGDKQNLMKIQTTFSNLLNSIISKNIDIYSFYTTSEVEQEKIEKFGKEYNRIPEGLLIRYTKDKDYDSAYKQTDFRFIRTNKSDYYHNFIMEAYFMAYLGRANYLLNINQPENADSLIRKALELKPDDRSALGMLKKAAEIKSRLTK